MIKVAVEKVNDGLPVKVELSGTKKYLTKKAALELATKLTRAVLKIENDCFGEVTL